MENNSCCQIAFFSQNLSELPTGSKDMSSKSFSLFLETISYIIIPFCASGIFGNILVVITYSKMGFSDSINISYSALAITDILGLLFLTWTAICFIPALSNSDIPFVANHLVNPTGGAIYDIFNGIAAWVTAYISLERCLCVVFPLKIKIIVTRKKTLFVILTIYAFIGVPLLCANFLLHQFESIFDPERNRTVVTVKYHHDSVGNALYSFVYFYKFAISNLTSLVIILICSSVLAIHLRRSASFRLKASAQPTNQMGSSLSCDHRTRRKYLSDMRVSKIVLTIASVSILLGCLNATRTLTAVLWPDFRPTRDYSDIFRFVSKLISLLYLVNTNVNLFIYYKMGTKFRRTLRQILRFDLLTG